MVLFKYYSTNGGVGIYKDWKQQHSLRSNLTHNSVTFNASSGIGKRISLDNSVLLRIANDGLLRFSQENAAQRSRHLIRLSHGRAVIITGIMSVEYSSMVSKTDRFGRAGGGGRRGGRR